MTANTGKDMLKHCINGITALGAGVSTISIYYSAMGEWRVAWLLMLLAMVLDCVDGPMVRFLALEEAAPQYDGDRLDEYADLLTYVIAPVCLALFYGLLPSNLIGITTVFLLVGTACLQFSRTNNKTEFAFWGWPSYWNIIYFYAWGLAIPTSWVVLVSVLLAMGTLLPVPFAYPSKLPILKKPTILLNGLWGVILALYVIFPAMPKYWLGISLLFPLYYACLSIYLIQNQDKWRLDY